MTSPSASITLDFGRMFSPTATGELTQNVLVEHDGFNCESKQVNIKPVILSGDVKSTDIKSPDVVTSQRWNLKFTKKVGADSSFETMRGNIIFQQGSASTPVQTLQIPLVIANVCNDTAQKKPLLFRMIFRDQSSGSKSDNGNIAAYSTFNWDVTGNYTVENNSDWVLTSAKTAFLLETRITNYSGVRYALQRYDRTPLVNARWAMDIGDAERDVTPGLILDELSHIPPGLVTIYNQAFNMSAGAKNVIFQLYPVPQGSSAKVFRDLSFVCGNIIKAAELGTESSAAATVSAFRLIEGSDDFLKRIAAEMRVPKFAMPAADGKLSGKIISGDFSGGDIISSVVVGAKVPDSMPVSGDTRGLLPIQVTFNMPKSNPAVAKKWDELQMEWRRSGNIKDLFSQYFTVNMRNAKWNNSDLFKWLKSNKTYEKNVKVFMDEQRGLITVSFLAMLMDIDPTQLALVNDKSSTSDYNHLIIGDGEKNGMWNMTFYTVPVSGSGGSSSTDPAVVPTTAGSSGGGCNAGFQGVSAALMGLALLLLKKR